MITNITHDTHEVPLRHAHLTTYAQTHNAHNAQARDQKENLTHEMTRHSTREQDGEKSQKGLPFKSVRARETITAAAAIARLEPRNWASVAQQTLLTSRSNLPDEEAAMTAGCWSCGRGAGRVRRGHAPSGN